MYWPPIGVSVAPPPVLVLVNSWLVLPRVLNIAQALVKLSVNATCWKEAAPKVASKSSEWPAAKVALVPAKAPSTCSAPPETVALPPAPPPWLSQVWLPQPAGSPGPAENSWPSAGFRMTSPLLISEMYVLASGVPAPKSETVVSVKLADGVVKLRGAAGGSGSVAELVAASVETTR